MVKEKKVLNAKQREILRVLHKKGGAMTTREISEVTGFSYKTVIKYLNELEELEIVTRRPHGKSKKS